LTLLAEIRRDGYTVSRGELDADNLGVAALSVAALEHRIPDRRLGEWSQKSAAPLNSSAVGCRRPEADVRECHGCVIASWARAQTAAAKDVAGPRL
jgi:hypothetical protein